MANELETAIRRLGLAFEGTEEARAHGMWDFRVRGGKTFATYAENHHGDGRIALWLNVPLGLQDSYVRSEPKQFFVPPYVGPRGWLGARLDRGMAWRQVIELMRTAYEHVAPPPLAQRRRQIRVPAPKRRITAADVDPKNTPRGKQVLAALRKICLELPETSEAVQFGQPVWRAGKRVFAQAYCYDGRWRAAFWVGIHAQGLMTSDPRFEIPAYLGHNGWIAIDVSRSHSEKELRALALGSYRHFALKRMIARVAQPSD
ncbi:MAG TPA: MmcQ/YjbR family DNA-binding protein [Steroidobacteraceae bacterium]|nr:MmcQ/YjbR family DNA-binding protein [Steroidobacteraceae bacterium]